MVAVFVIPGNFAPCWQTCGRDWKEFKAIESHAGSWFLFAKRAPRREAWAELDLNDVAKAGWLKATLLADREERNKGQSQKQIELYKDFAGTASHKLTQDGGSVKLL